MSYEDFEKIREQKYMEMQKRLNNTTDKETRKMILHNYNEEMRELRHCLEEE